MHLNTTTLLRHPRVTLIPYSAHHVPTYHSWMQSPELQEATASAPLSLDQEFAMQKSWRRDGDKLTFIICRPLTDRKGGGESFTGEGEARRGRGEEMVGDVNMFLSEPDDDGDVDVSVVAELELMIAKPEDRRKGYGRAAVKVFLGFIVEHWPQVMREYKGWKGFQGGEVQGSKGGNEEVEACCFVVKMKEGNEGSIGLFKSLGFRAGEGGANYFGEVEMRLRPTAEWVERVKAWHQQCEVLDYPSEEDKCH